MSALAHENGLDVDNKPIPTGIDYKRYTLISEHTGAKY
jgi:hypothetical protein